MAELAQIGVTGLAVMGRNLARNFASHGYRVAVHNRTYAKTQSLIDEHGNDGKFVPSESMASTVLASTAASGVDHGQGGGEYGCGDRRPSVA